MIRRALTAVQLAAVFGVFALAMFLPQVMPLPVLAVMAAALLISAAVVRLVEGEPVDIVWQLMRLAQLVRSLSRVLRRLAR